MILKLVKPFHILRNAIYKIISFPKETVEDENISPDNLGKKNCAIKIGFTSFFENRVDGLIGFHSSNHVFFQIAFFSDLFIF